MWGKKYQEEKLTVYYTTLFGIALWALIPGFIAKKKGRSFLGYYLLSFLITPLITMIITLCVSDLNEENKVTVIDMTTKEILNNSPENNIIEAPKKNWCRYCGHIINPGDNFCGNCGKRII